jgi:chaperonin cofactor prefoldin
MGATTPFVLRKLDEMDGDKKVYRFIGNAYVHGVMKGEAMVDLEKEKYELETVALV